MGEVMLGMPGPWAEDYLEASDHYTTKIGGLPDWPTQDMNSGPDFLNCGLCGEKLCLVAQVYAPISMPNLNVEERVIYIFGCQMPKCGSNPRSWRAIRVQKCRDEKEAIDTKEPRAVEEISAPISKSMSNGENLLGFGEDLLGFGEDDESDDDIDLEELSRAFSEAGAQASLSKIQIRSAHPRDARNSLLSKPRSVDGTSKQVPCFYIYSQKAQPRSDVSVMSASCSSLSIKESESPAKDNDDEERWEGEDYEYDRALNADRTYLKFKKQLDLQPQQCFRYSYGGKPLLTTTNVVQPDTCRLCGSRRHYEMQLMSPLLYFLHEAADGSSTDIPEEWSWMTLILYTCSTSCCPSSCKLKSGSCGWAVAEEAIIIQDE
ncbi:programmed cell death protein 2-like isoform X2 [Asparagus officinalis]|uniref:programmed cell death protein 2-like isoform X2 n=1 Tax=Asparagus officinalis TaxID=4686 RepID=UPI00098E0D3E|nr:programmed cell death protein 2-like isoform X2 [Asparagus officinalis]